MVGFVFGFVAILFLFSGGCELAMRIRLTRLELPSEKLSWWRRGGDDVAETYKELFPQSRLPFFRTFIFWFFLAFTLALFLFIVFRRV